MNLKLRNKVWRKFFWVFSFLLVGGAIVLFWMNRHRQNIHKDLFSRISNQMNFGVIHLDEVYQLLKTEKLWPAKDGDSTSSLFDFIKSPMKLGIDLSANPIIYQEAKDSAILIAFALSNSSKFETWLNEGPGSVWPIHTKKHKNFTLCKFDGKDFRFAFNDYFALLISQTEGGEEAAQDFFGSEPQGKPTEPISSPKGALITFHLNTVFETNLAGLLPISVSGPISLFVNDSVFTIGSEAYKFENEEVSHFTATISEEIVKDNNMSLLHEIWNISSNDSVDLSGNWKWSWYGTEIRHLKFISYDFDDDFNRVQTVRIKKEFFPDIELVYQPNDSFAAKKWLQHLKSQNLIRNDSVQIGSFRYPFIQKGDFFCVKCKINEAKNINFSTSFYAHFPSLIRDFDRMSIPFPFADSILHTNLKSIAISSEMNHLRMELVAKEESTYHILALIEHLFHLTNP